MNALYFRQARLQSKNSGFTIVELLIVIVVIGILAAITIVSYNGIQKRAIETVITSDLQGSGTQVETENVFSGNYPPNGYQPKSGSNATIVYTYYPSTNSYCLQATSTRNSSDIFRLSSEKGAVEKLACAAVALTMPAPANLYFGQGAQNAYVDWVWPATVTPAQYTVQLTVTCVASSATLTTREQTNITANPGQAGPVMSVNKSELSSCPSNWRFAIRYVYAPTGVQSPAASVTS